MNKIRRDFESLLILDHKTLFGGGIKPIHLGAYSLKLIAFDGKIHPIVQIIEKNNIVLMVGIWANILEFN